MAEVFLAANGKTCSISYIHVPSLSAMATVAVAGGTTLAFVSTATTVTVKTSVPSERKSSIMGMLQHTWLSVPGSTRGLHVMGP